MNRWSWHYLPVLRLIKIISMKFHSSIEKYWSSVFPVFHHEKRLSQQSVPQCRGACKTRCKTVFAQQITPPWVHTPIHSSRLGITVPIEVCHFRLRDLKKGNVRTRWSLNKFSRFFYLSRDTVSININQNLN